MGRLSSSVPDPRSGLLQLAPSRARRAALAAGALATAVLAAILARAPGQGSSALAALACAAGAAMAAVAAWRGRHPRAVLLHRADAVGLGAGRIVLREAGTRPWQSDIVVWRDAVAPATYRRLAVFARWDPHRAPRAAGGAEGGKRG
jgi:hypothetical protein